MRLFSPRHTAHLSLGGNLGDRLEALRTAIGAIAATGAETTRVSPVYETPPMYRTDQPPFLNMAVAIRTPLAPAELLVALNRIEADAGRVRDGTRNGPRPLDIDILTHDEAVIREPELVIPHPGIAERPFVLVPLATIAHDLVVPGLDESVGTLVARVEGAGDVRRYAAPPDAGRGGGDTYTIFLRDLVAPLPRAGSASGPGPSARLTARLEALHPGRQFADDIAAVLSYEDVVVDLRRLCAHAATPDPAALALAAADRALTHPDVRSVEVEISITPSAPPDASSPAEEAPGGGCDIAPPTSERRASITLKRS